VSRLRIHTIALALLIAAAGVTPAAAAEETVVRVGILLPLNGEILATTGPIREGALLTLAGAAIPGVRIEPVVLDHAVDGVRSPEKAAEDLAALVADPSVVAVIGPYNSSVAEVLIPIATEAGLLLCSPSNTLPELTVGPRAAELRAGRADRPAYIRTSATDAVQAPVMARLGRERLGLTRIAVVDDGDVYGRTIADLFSAAWAELGGEVTGRETAPVGSADPRAIAERLAATDPEAFYFGGLPATGAGAFRSALVELGLGELPYLVAEGANDGPASMPGTFLDAAGPGSGEIWSAGAAPHDYPGREAFAAAYGSEPPPYAATASACADVVLEAIAAGGSDPQREAVRAFATDPGRTFASVFGPISFDANGDIVQRWVSLFRSAPADPAAEGSGTWEFVEQIAIEGEG